EHPRAERPLAVAAGRGVARVQAPGRGEVDLDRVVALELRGELALEVAVRVEARDLVLVLVGEELEVVTGDRLGERARAGHGLALACGDPPHELAGARGQALALLGDEGL